MTDTTRSHGPTKSEDVNSDCNWNGCLQILGMIGVDFGEPVDYRRLQIDRIARARQATEGSELGERVRPGANAVVQPACSGR
jgi:hypothetical protein